MALSQAILAGATAQPNANVTRGAQITIQVNFELDGNKPFDEGIYFLRLTQPAPDKLPMVGGELVHPNVKPQIHADRQEIEFRLPDQSRETHIHANLVLNTTPIDEGRHTLRFELIHPRNGPRVAEVTIVVTDPLNVKQVRSVVSKDVVASSWSDDVVLYGVIKAGLGRLSFAEYKKALDGILCSDAQAGLANAVLRAMGDPQGVVLADEPQPLVERRFLPFNDTDAYRILKVATEAFVAVNSVVCPQDANQAAVLPPGLLPRLVRDVNPIDPPTDATDQFVRQYLRELNGVTALPYYHLIQQKLEGSLKFSIFPRYAQYLGDRRVQADVAKCEGILRRKLSCPIMLELIRSYWHEQGMQVQTMFALRDRFQNKRSPVGPDPLTAFEMSHLRPLNNILWGYIQDEQHRLTITRRAYEYDHHYGLKLHGSAVPPMQTADSRSRFLEAFHNLLALCVVFFKEDDDTNRRADAFPVLNALKEVHFLLSEGAHNQYGDLPTTSRIEMLMEQWILARPEMQQFLPSRDSIAYPEPWMGTVDAMKTIQGWTNTSVLYFHDLANFGEQILLSIRFNNWSQVFERANAANWARVWRSEIQGYMHAYRTVTGVDLAAEAKDAPRLAERNTDPAVLIQRRYDEQKRLGQANRGGMRLPGVPTAARPAALRSAVRRPTPLN